MWPGVTTWLDIENPIRAVAPLARLMLRTPEGGGEGSRSPSLEADLGATFERRAGLELLVCTDPEKAGNLTDVRFICSSVVPDSFIACDQRY